MPIYLKHTGNLKNFMIAMGIDPIFYQQAYRAEFEEQLNKDLPRIPVISFKTPAYVEKSKIFDPGNYESMQTYSQGQFEALTLTAYFWLASIYNKLNMEENLVLAEKNGQDYLNRKYITYIDDSGIPCAISFISLGMDLPPGSSDNPSTEPNYKHMIVVFRNITASLTETEDTIVCESTLFDGGNDIKTEVTQESEALNSLKSEIGSSSIFELIAKVMVNGHISKQNIDKLDLRIRNMANLDNRDIRIQQFQEWLEIAKQIDSKLAENKKRQAKEDVNFFETKQFESLLFESIVFADYTPKEDISLTQKMYQLQLKYLLENFRKKASENSQPNDTQLEEIRQRLNSLHYTINPNFEAFKDQALSLYQQVTFEYYLYQLAENAYTNFHPYLRQKRLELLEQMNRIDFNKLQDNQKESLITLTKEWSIAKGDIPDTDRLDQTYREFNLKKPDKKQLKLPPKEARINMLVHDTNQGFFTFDPQGRIIYDAVDHNGHIVTISKDFPLKSSLSQQYHIELASSLRKTLRDQQKLKKSTITVLQKGRIDARIRHIFSLMDKLPTTSGITPLQQELHILLGSMGRTYQNSLQNPNFSEQDCAKIIASTMQEVSKKVRNGFARALIKATDSISDWENATLNVETINQVLATVREEILPGAKDLLLRSIEKKISSEHTITDMQSMSSSPSNMTLPILHIDNATKVATWIESHHSQQGFNYTKVGTYRIGHPISATTLNTPIVLSGFQKFSTTHSALYFKKLNEQLLESIKSYGSTTPFTLHLLNPEKNITTIDAKNMIQAIHQFNRDTLRSMHLCYLQASELTIENQALGYRWFDWSGFNNELTLMSEMALMNQLNEPKIITSYEKFLRPKPAAKSYWSRIIQQWFATNLFSQTQEGSTVRTTIQKLKSSWQSEQPIPSKLEDVPTLIAYSLKKLMAFDLHFGSDYSQLIQILSIAQADAPQSVLVDESSKKATVILNVAALFGRKPIDTGLLTALQNLSKSSNKTSAKIAAQALNNLLIESPNFKEGPAMVLSTIQASTKEQDSIKHASPTKESLKQYTILNSPTWAQSMSPSHQTIEGGQEATKIRLQIPSSFISGRRKSPPETDESQGEGVKSGFGSRRQD